jgi:predicted dehydrogenase
MNRRSFVASAASAAVPLHAQDARTGTAVIGVGGRGAYLTSGVLDQPVAKVVALCDIKPDRLDKVASLAGRDNPATHKDWREVIERKDVSAVFIATPPDLHAEMAIAALKAGKHVYCEKPIGITAASLRELVATARQSKLVFTAGQQLRSMKRHNAGIRLIREGAIGDILMVKAQRHATTDLPHDGTSGDWYFDVKRSGGYLIEQSVHNLDLCNWVIGSRPVRAAGFSGTTLYKNAPPGRSITDHCSLSFDYANGVKLAFTQNVFHPRSLPAGGQYVYVYGSKGAVDMFNPASIYPLDPKAAPAPFVDKMEEPPHAHITAFYECVASGAPSPADVVVGATAALTSLMGHLAMTENRIVNWTEFGVDF